MAWEPPLTVEEKLKAVLVPPRLQTWYHLVRERIRGEREILLVPFLADRNRVSVDVGANKGVWTEALRKCSRQVHAFEPNPKIFKVLRRGVGQGVEAHHMALSDAAGTAELRVPRHRKGGYSNQGATLSAEKIGPAEYRSVFVEARRLDDLDLGDVGFIKIDVEGHELAVVEGARETLRRCRPNLVVEIEEVHAKRPIAELLGAVCAHGYEAFALDRGVLRPVDRIDLTARHSRPASRADYIFNWIFMPFEEARRPAG